MSRNFFQMSLDELWRLFPIFLTGHKPYWADWYTEEVTLLKNILPHDTEYHHIGSTAVSGIMAKPIIDILVAVESIDRLEDAANLLHERNYIIMSKSAARISLNKGYTESGFAEMNHYHKSTVEKYPKIKWEYN